MKNVASPIETGERRRPAFPLDALSDLSRRGGLFGGWGPRL